MTDIKSHKDLKVWQESMDLVTDIYELVQNFPAEEKYNLTSQIKRSSVSIPSNIAEGAGRKSNLEFIQFLNIASGSLSELETQLEIAIRLKFITENEELLKKIIFIRIMITNLKKSLSNKPSPPL
ncbi:four helix bundle protein [Elizabethkingia anophelis]|uniref:four helix bundle protein n=1 Tax=Elizabethkingia anophelis TaxID=1117645 RepID=UPI002011A1EF|nr:four helix bundle protein [Elizabethkingia anophelis]MCL1689218.1 four helix bundle protein [Elizabethkingia anophelis]MDV3574394.1 four helix bundle protein [Elizabethkingia anophelis]MDV3598092.1 four helix bundle protein [Elizabethkingia anophelis]MDV3607608.1 four helix bundle protein [Elizabethkingia anophelis]MDV3638419.1 four helix bundle protein [Elizabethkingia anophelis]